jgi:hypothetical protein
MSARTVISGITNYSFSAEWEPKENVYSAHLKLTGDLWCSQGNQASIAVITTHWAGMQNCGVCRA